MRKLWLSFWVLLLTFPVAAEQHKGWLFTEALEPFHLVLVDQESLEKFREKLPERIPAMKQPAPLNPDPLKTTSLVDFSKQRLLIVAVPDTTSAYPIFQSRTERDGVLIVTVEIPEPPPEAKPYGWGVYIAIPLPDTGKPIKIDYR